MSLILDGTNGVSDIDGSASTPAIRGTDTNTGIFFPAADTIAFSEGGTESMRIDSSGNVGIGTSSPVSIAGYTIQTLNNATTGSGVYLQSAGTDRGRFLVTSTAAFVGARNGLPLVFEANATEAMRIDTSGNVGIGTSSPQAKLHVSGTTTRPIIQATNTAGNADIKYQSTNRTYVVGVNTGGAAGEFAFYDDTAGAERMRIDSSGNLLVGTTSVGSGATYGSVYLAGDRNVGSGNYYAQAFIQHNSSTNHGLVIKELNTAGTAVGFLNSGGTVVGTIGTGASSTSYNTSSDYRLKENIAPMTGALAKVNQLKPCTYTWKSTGEASQGFIAHELQAVVPDCVTGEKDAVDAEGNPVYQGIDTSFLVATLTAAIQEQQAIITDLKARIETLEAK